MPTKLICLAGLLASVMAAPALADALPDRDRIESAVTQGQPIDSRAGKYQGSRGGAR